MTDNTALDLPVDLPEGFERIGRNLGMDGRDLVALAREHGTPLFVFSERRLRDNAGGFLRAARAGHPRATVCYASKACSNLNVLGIIREEGLSIEVNSGGEISKALAAGFAPTQMVFNEVTLPLSLPGLGAGLLLSFVLAAGSYVTPQILGGRKDSLFGNLIYDTIMKELNWPMGTVLSVVLLVLLGIVSVVYSRYMGLSTIYKGLSR